MVSLWPLGHIRTHVGSGLTLKAISLKPWPSVLFLMSHVMSGEEQVEMVVDSVQVRALKCAHNYVMTKKAFCHHQPVEREGKTAGIGCVQLILVGRKP